MEPPAEFASEVENLAKRAFHVLESNPSGVTAWEMKLRLKSPLATLYMALGGLLKEGAVLIEPDRLTYRVRPAAPSGGTETASKSAPAQDPEPGKPPLISHSPTAV